MDERARTLRQSHAWQTRTRAVAALAVASAIACVLGTVFSASLDLEPIRPWFYIDRDYPQISEIRLLYWLAIGSILFVAVAGGRMVAVALLPCPLTDRRIARAHTVGWLLLWLAVPGTALVLTWIGVALPEPFLSFFILGPIGVGGVLAMAARAFTGRWAGWWFVAVVVTLYLTAFAGRSRYGLSLPVLAIETSLWFFGWAMRTDAKDAPN